MRRQKRQFKIGIWGPGASGKTVFLQALLRQLRSDQTLMERLEWKSRPHAESLEAIQALERGWMGSKSRTTKQDHGTK